MASTTRLLPSGTPGEPVTFVAKTAGASAREGLLRFTALQPSGVPGLERTFTAKQVAEEAAKFGTDTVFLSATEDPVDEQSIVGWDVCSLTLTENASKTVVTAVPRTDTAVIVLYESGSVANSATTSKAGTDTASISLTEVATSPVPEAIATTDTASITLTEVATVTATGQAKTATDTASLTLVEDALINAVSPSLQMATDTALLSAIEQGVVSAETLFRTVRIELVWPEWKINLRVK